jgi:hypothetical protein
MLGEREEEDQAGNHDQAPTDPEHPAEETGGHPEEDGDEGTGHGPGGYRLRSRFTLHASRRSLDPLALSVEREA